MAKIDINFNNTNYTIDESSLSSAKSALQQHLSTAMAGAGAQINFGGVAYNIDATKLSTATNDLISHLGTVAGSGCNITVNGVEYAVDSAKVQNAIADMHTALGDLQSGGNSGLNEYGFYSGFYVGTDGETTFGFDLTEKAIADNCVSIFTYSSNPSAFFSQYGLSFDDFIAAGEVLSQTKIEFNGITLSLSDEDERFPAVNDIYFTDAMEEEVESKVTIIIGEQNAISVKVVDSNGTTEFDATYVTEGSRYSWVVNSSGISSVHPSYDGLYMMVVFYNGSSEILSSSCGGGSDTLTWDGNTEGLEYVEITDDIHIYRMSDAVPTIDDCVNGVHITFITDTGVFDGDLPFESIIEYDGAISFNYYAIVVPYDGCEVEGTVVPKAGTYFVEEFGYHTTSLTINGYNGF